MERAKCIEVDIRSGWADAEKKINDELKKLDNCEITARELVPTPAGKAHVLIMYKPKVSKG